MNTDNKGHDLSPEEMEVERILADATKRLEEIDFWLRHPRDLPSPQPTPTGFSMGGLDGNKKDHQKKLLECRKDVVKAEAKEQAVKALEKSPLPVQLRAFVRIDDWVEPKEDRKKNLKERTDGDKSISESQDVAMLKMADEKKIIMQPEQPKNTVEISKPVEPPPPGPEPPSFWERFDASMGYNNLSGKEDYTPQKTDKEIEIEPER